MRVQIFNLILYNYELAHSGFINRTLAKCGHFTLERTSEFWNNVHKRNYTALYQALSRGIHHQLYIHNKTLYF